MTLYTCCIMTIEQTNKSIFITIADMFSNKKLNPIVTELFIRGRNQIISLVFTAESLVTKSL